MLLKIMLIRATQLQPTILNIEHRIGTLHCVKKFVISEKLFTN